MLDVLFTNHLRLGSASSYRQAGLAKHLSMIGDKTSLLCRSISSGKTINAPRKNVILESKNWSHYTHISYWKEPLVTEFFSNVELFSKVSRDSSVIHVNRANPYTASIISAARSSNRKLVVDMEDWDGFGGYSSYSHKYGPVGGILTFYEEFFPRTADVVIVVSTLLRNLMLRAHVPREKIFLIPNGFDDSLFNQDVSGSKIRESYSLDGRPVVIYASTFWEFEKSNHEIALGAFRKISKLVPDVRFLLVGSGNMELQSMFGRYGLEKNAIATGFVPREIVPELMAAADVAMHVISDHPFHAASSPMIISEYMAVGKPVVAPRVGELTEMLGYGAGLLVNKPDPELLADGVIELLKNEALRFNIGKAARMKAVDNYSYSVLAKHLQRAYNSVIN
jgi:glycosyltransferase involved in cell wall biosynthesis